MTLLASESALKKYNLKPKARLVAYSTNSLSPDLFPDAPVGAIEAASARAGIKVTDVDLFEVNEAFSVVAMIAIKELKLDPEKVNVNGGAVSLGHPIGASGGRLAATLVRELGRRQVRYGLATLCIGGGEAVAVVFERVIRPSRTDLIQPNPRHVSTAEEPHDKHDRCSRRGADGERHRARVRATRVSGPTV